MARLLDGGPHLRPPRLNVRRRMGRCFELAGRGQQAVDPTWSLVHGYIAVFPDKPRRNCLMMAHAWLQKGHTVYDPVVDSVFSSKEYTDRFGAKPQRRYSAALAARFIHAFKHWGPWHLANQVVLRDWLVNGN